MDESVERSRGTRPNQTPRPIGALNRRRFLVVLGGAAAYSALKPWDALAKKVRPAPALQPWSLPSDPPANPVDLARALIGAAVLAPSNWNSQPWRMEVHNGAIRLAGDPSRALPVTDPERREMLISLGAALENLLIASRAYALNPTVRYFPDEPQRDVVAEVSWIHGDVRRDRQLFWAIPARRTNRREYDGRGIYMQNRAALLAQVPPELNVHWIDGRRPLRELADLVRDTVHAQVMNRDAQTERLAWMRFGDDDARERGDGVTLDGLQIGGPARWLAGSYFDPRSWFLRYGAGTLAKQARERVRSSGAVALLCARRRDEMSWVTAGQAYERFALKATQLGIAQHPINEPIHRPRSRDALVAMFGAAGEDPLMLVRLGHAKRVKPSARRAVSVVASFRRS